MATTLLGVAMGCVGLIIAVRTRSVQVTVNSWLLFMPLAFLTSAFMPRELITGWFQFAVGLNPVEYILVAVRTVIIDGWDVGAHRPRLLGPPRHQRSSSSASPRTSTAARRTDASAQGSRFSA